MIILDRFRLDGPVAIVTAPAAASAPRPRSPSPTRSGSGFVASSPAASFVTGGVYGCNRGLVRINFEMLPDNRSKNEFDRLTN